jgi:hypothetical protein
MSYIATPRQRPAPIHNARNARSPVQGPQPQPRGAQWQHAQTNRHAPRPASVQAGPNNGSGRDGGTGERAGALAIVSAIAIATTALRPRRTWANPWNGERQFMGCSTGVWCFTERNSARSHGLSRPLVVAPARAHHTQTRTGTQLSVALAEHRSPPAGSAHIPQARAVEFECRVRPYTGGPRLRGSRSARGRRCARPLGPRDRWARAPSVLPAPAQRTVRPSPRSGIRHARRLRGEEGERAAAIASRPARAPHGWTNLTAARPLRCGGGRAAAVAPRRRALAGPMS